MISKSGEQGRPCFQSRVYRPVYISILLVLLLLFALKADGQAQPEALTVVIDPVVAGDEFPQVAAFVTVRDAAGLPVVDLTESDFQVIEDGLELPETMVTVETETAPQSAFVLALDLSLDEPGDLTGVKEAALAFIETLGAQDQLTLLVYHDDVETLFQGSAADKAALKQIVADLEETGSNTAFYEALRQAEAAFAHHASIPPARRAIVTITNVGNNVSGAAANEAKAAIEAENRVPLYIISYGQRADAAQLESLLAKTKGQYLNVSDAETLAPALQQTGRRLRQGYKVSFQPNRNLDGGQRHNFTIRATTSQGKSGQAQAGVDLALAEVKITLSGVRDLHLGQSLVVTAAIDSPILVDAVSYRVDDGPAFVTREPPYQFIWASANVEPGPHTLTVAVTDQAGNSAVNQTPFTVFQIIAPLAKVDWGRDVTLEAEINQPARVAGVEFWLAGALENKLIGRVDGSPYRFIFTPDNPAYPPAPDTSAQYTIIARVAYKQPGQAMIEDKFAIEFLKPPRTAAPIIPAWLWRSMSGTCLAGAYFLILPLLLTVWTHNRRRRVEALLASCSLTIKNWGNVATSFHLSALAAGADDALQFQFGEIQAYRPGPYRYHPNGATGAAADTGYRQDPALESVETVSAPATNAPDANGATPVPGRASQKGAGGKRAAGQAGGLGNMVIGVLDGLSGIPYLGRPFRSIVGSIRQTKSEAGRVARMPGQVTKAVSRTTQHLPGANNAAARPAAAAPVQQAVALDQAPPRLEPAPPETAASPVAPGRSDPTTVDGVARGWPDPATDGVAADRSAPDGAGSPPTLAPVADPSAWATAASFETSLVEPGRKLTVALWVRPVPAPYQTRCYRFQATVVRAGDADESGPFPEKKSEERVEIAGLPRWYHPFWFWTPALLILGSATVLWLVLLLYTWG